MTKKIPPLENPVYEGIRAESVLLKRDMNLLKGNFAKVKLKLKRSEILVRELKNDNSKVRETNRILRKDLEFARKHITKLRAEE